MNNIRIGNYCSIAENVVCDGGMNHNVSYISTYPFKSVIGTGNDQNTCKGDIVIGNDVWIGEDVLIMSGVTIGDGAIIAAKSKVTKDVPPYHIVGGYPAKLIRMRFPPEIVKKMLKIQWWYWDEQKIKDNALILSSDNIDGFLELHG